MTEKMRAEDAIRLVCGGKRDRFESALTDIIERHRYGLLTATCTLMIEQYRDVRSGASSPERVTKDATVPEWIWEILSKRNSPMDWHTGNFSGRGYAAHLGRSRNGLETVQFKLIDVRFDRAGIEDLAPREVPPGLSPPLKDANTAIAPAAGEVEREARQPANRPEKRTASLQIYLKRLHSGQTCQERPDEARAIVKGWTGENRPTWETVNEKYLRPFHALGEWRDGKITNADRIIAAVEADLAAAVPR